MAMEWLKSQSPMVDPAVQAAVAADRVPYDMSVEYLSRSHDQWLLATVGVGTALTFGFFSLRMISKIWIIRKFGLDDALAAICMALITALCVISCVLIKIGLARHNDYLQYVIPSETLSYGDALDKKSYYVYTTALLVGRSSGLVFYYFSIPASDTYNRGLRIAVLVVAAVHFLGFIPQILLNFFRCLHVTTVWPLKNQLQADEDGCMDWHIVLGASAGISLFCDLLVFGIPVAMLKMFEVPRGLKLPLLGILSIGFFVVLISFTRLLLIIESYQATGGLFLYGTMLAVKIAETGATLVALSVPGIKPLFDQYFSGGKTAASEKGRSGSKMSEKRRFSSPSEPYSDHLDRDASVNGNHDEKGSEAHYWDPVSFQDVRYGARGRTSSIAHPRMENYDPKNFRGRRETIYEANES